MQKNTLYNRHRVMTRLIIYIIAAILPLQVLAEQMPVKVTGIGFIVGGDVATARDQAIRDAQIRAVEQVCGLSVDARTVLHKTLLIDDTAFTRTRGVVKKYQILEERFEKYGLYSVTLEALVDTVVVADELSRLAGEKKVLLIRCDRGREKNSQDDILINKLAQDFNDAGFSLAQTSLDTINFQTLDSEKINTLSNIKGYDIVISLMLESTEASCPAKNFCAGLAQGFVRLYAGDSKIKIADEKVNSIRGFGNTPGLARKEALVKGAEGLKNALMASLFHPQEKTVKVVVHKIPDYEGYKSLKKIIKTLRWVQDVKDDTVGYHKVKSVFIVRCTQNLDLFGAMLDKIGEYRFMGRNSNVFTLEAK